MISSDISATRHVGRGADGGRAWLPYFHGSRGGITKRMSNNIK